MTDVTVTFTYTADEAARMAHLVERVDRCTTLAYDDHDRLLLISSAIRRALPPPRPAEPQGLGAVVEDAKGRRWVRYPRPSEHSKFCWNAGNGAVKWSEIDSPKVLSEGWSE